MKIRVAPKSALTEAAARLTHSANRELSLTADRRADLHEVADTLGDLIRVADSYRVTSHEVRTTENVLEQDSTAIVGHAPRQRAYSHVEISTALNRAADEIAEALGLPDEGTRDALNLLVNSGLHYLQQPAAALGDVVDAAYHEELTTVLGWCQR